MQVGFPMEVEQNPLFRCIYCNMSITMRTSRDFRRSHGLVISFFERYGITDLMPRRKMNFVAHVIDNNIPCLCDIPRAITQEKEIILRNQARGQYIRAMSRMKKLLKKRIKLTRTTLDF